MRAVLFGVLALAIGAGIAQAQLAIDRKLIDAGFTMRSVDTPKQMEQARRLPQRTIVERTKDGKHHYLYADTEYCKCVLGGNAQALQAYRDMALPPPAVPRRRHRAARHQSDESGDAGHGLRLHGPGAGPYFEFRVLRGTYWRRDCRWCCSPSTVSDHLSPFGNRFVHLQLQPS